MYELNPVYQLDPGNPFECRWVGRVVAEMEERCRGEGAEFRRRERELALQVSNMARTR